MVMLAPYNESMRLGSGFNSFTQEMCLDHAVLREETSSTATIENIDETGVTRVAQSVVYKTSIIDKATDVLDSMNINAAFTIKFGQGSVNGNGVFETLSKVKSSDLTYMVSVKVVNQVEHDATLTKFSPIPGLKATDFGTVYGDCFISGFQTGGEFLAIIAIRAKDRNQANHIKADAAVNLTTEKLGIKVDGQFDKTANNLLIENETTITVSWIGGGQGIKKPESDWTFDTMRAAALAFPDLVAKCPMRTQAILTKYSSLKSFHSSGPLFRPLSYEGARVYTSALQDAFLDYQNIAKNLQVLAFDVTAGTQVLVTRGTVLPKDFGKTTLKASNPNLLSTMTNTPQLSDIAGDTTSAVGVQPVSSDVSADSKSDKSDPDMVKVDGLINGASEDVTHGADGKTALTSLPEKKEPPKPLDPLVIDTPYPATVFGLEAAKMQCRFMMNRIIAEVDVVAEHPEIAVDETRPLPYMSPFLFQQLLPVGAPVGA